MNATITLSLRKVLDYLPLIVLKIDERVIKK